MSFRPLLVAPTAALAFALSWSLPAFAAMHATGPAKIVFHGIGSPGFLDIDGTTSDIAVTEDGGTLRFTVRLDTVTTGIELRDEHMKSKFLQTAQFPTADLTVARAAVTWPTELGKAESGTVEAPFTAHGATRSVKVDYTIRKSKTGWNIRAKFPFDISGHGIEVPSYLGVTVSPAMTADVVLDVADR